MPGHGLIVGKFYPPHAGHHHLIDVAAAGSERLTVLCLVSDVETIPLEVRVAALRERHPGVDVVGGVDNHRVVLDDAEIWEAHMAIFRQLCPRPVDVVYTSESYGDELARRLGARHVAVDPPRSRVPVSGTAVRADPARHWHHLGPVIRSYLTRRVAIVGAESTGTTTLSRALAQHYRTAWVAEYGREVSARLLSEAGGMDAIRWRDADFAAIARTQGKREDAAARRAGPVLICDTDPLATCVWQERYLGRSTSATETLAATRRYALYVLTSDDTPFVQDGLRDGENVRSWMTQRFRERLEAREEPWLEVRGTHAERLAAAVAAIDALPPHRFGEPLG